MSTKKILVVDDEETIRNIISKNLEKKGYQVSLAEDYDSAVQIIGKNKFDLIFTDVMMPFNGGFDLIDYLKDNESTKNIPVVLVTGMDKNVLHSTSTNADLVIEKPFDINAITSAAEKLIS